MVESTKKLFLKRSPVMYGAVFLAFLYQSCGISGQNNSSDFNGLVIGASLAREATNSDSNSLVLEAPSGYLFAVSGEGFTVDVEKGEYYPVTEPVNISDYEFGSNILTINMIEDDGTLVLKKDLRWKYSDGLPPDPVVSFSTGSTNTPSQFLLAAGNKGIDTKELWVQGDLIDSEFPEGSWKEISSLNKVPVTLSDGDGLKVFKVKYRNIYGAESEELSVSILLKSDPPSGCTSELISSKSGDGNIKIQLSAIDSGPTYYRIYGQTKKLHTFKEFTNSEVINLELEDGEGEKVITVQIRDNAENYCLQEEQTILVDPNYLSEEIFLKNREMFVPEITIFVDFQYDFFPGDNPEMNIYGAVSDTEKTFEWIPYEPRLSLNLLETRGHRILRAKFRNNRGEESGEKTVAVFLRPTMTFSGSSSPYLVYPSQVQGLTDMTVTGCSESYDHVQLQTSFSCSAASSAPITINFYLKNGTIATVNSNIP